MTDWGFGSPSDADSADMPRGHLPTIIVAIFIHLVAINPLSRQIVLDRVSFPTMGITVGLGHQRHRQECYSVPPVFQTLMTAFFPFVTRRSIRSFHSSSLHPQKPSI